MKKWRMIQQKFTMGKSNFINGFISGAMIGGMFGFCIGIFTAFQTRRFITIPLSMMASGVSFGAIVAFGSLIRS